MKGLTKEMKDSSERKWMRFIEECEREIGGYYYSIYWKPCGFCRAVGEGDNGIDAKCYLCDLFKKQENGMPVCYSSGSDYTSHGHRAVGKATAGEFKQALVHGRIVLKAIRAAKIEK